MIQAELLNDLLFYCKQQLPHEACGFLYGQRTTHDSFRIDRFVSIPNISRQPDKHFEMDPRHLISAVLPVSRGHEELLGLFHSHPTAPAIPSQEDLSTPWRAVPSHWIVSLQDPQRPKLGVFSYTSNGCEQLEVRYIGQA
jgi:[CysO sulfur-carrier protein]-S-L-cysteine hydrolase